MSCGFTGLYVRGFPQGDQGKVFGTWDFKWPRNKQILVAFQKPPEACTFLTENFELIARKIAAYAKTWNDVAPKEAPRFDFFEVGGNLRVLPEPLGDGKTQASRSGPRGGAEPVAYDVLVSITPLPITYTVERKVKPAHPNEAIFNTVAQSSRILLPTSQLGRFAQRVDYGTPTLYLGMPQRENFPDEATYFSVHGSSASKEFESTIVHEFGHALGLPHLHQSPLARPRWRSVGELETIVEKNVGVQVSEAFIRSQLLLPHPSTRTADGRVLFSDWSTPPLDADGDPIIRSVMAHPLLGLLLAESADPEAPVIRLVEPQADDKAFLQRMYPSA